MQISFYSKESKEITGSPKHLGAKSPPGSPSPTIHPGLPSPRGEANSAPALALPALQEGARPTFQGLMLSARTDLCQRHPKHDDSLLQMLKRLLKEKSQHLWESPNNLCVTFRRRKVKLVCSEHQVQDRPQAQMLPAKLHTPLQLILKVYFSKTPNK